MADIRENLIDILRKTRYEYRRYIGMKDYEKRMAKTEEEFCAVDDSIVGEIPFCADHLIAHGVTVQEWISVKDRLPDNSATVNLCTRSKIVGTGFYNKYTKSWVQYYSGGAICVDVTHWQPMPQPPKGE